MKNKIYDPEKSVIDSNRLNAAMENANVGGKELAKRVNDANFQRESGGGVVSVTYQTIQNYRKGKRSKRPDPDIVKAICAVLDIDESYLRGDDPLPNRKNATLKQINDEQFENEYRSTLTYLESFGVTLCKGDLLAPQGKSKWEIDWGDGWSYGSKESVPESMVYFLLNEIKSNARNLLENYFVGALRYELVKKEKEIEDRKNARLISEKMLRESFGDYPIPETEFERIHDGIIVSVGDSLNFLNHRCSRDNAILLNALKDIIQIRVETYMSTHPISDDSKGGG